MVTITGQIKMIIDKLSEAAKLFPIALAKEYAAIKKTVFL
jgi:hypothetical protein